MRILSGRWIRDALLGEDGLFVVPLCQTENIMR